jgi:transcription elongation factor Elf1
MMHKSGASETGASSNDIYFDCQHCSSPLVVDVAAAGMTLECQRCGKPTHVPAILAAAAATASTDEIRAELQRHLKENASQRTEVIGYINQLSIQLHRWQHRLKTMSERETELEIQIAAVTGKRS